MFFHLEFYVPFERMFHSFGDVIIEGLQRGRTTKGEIGPDADQI